ncbi:MAG: phage tail assembly protein [Treponema sp.]|nr:phage tail assembly protein [Treponema sp.]
MIDPFATETVTLRHPVTVGERTVTELRFKPPKVKDLLQAGAYPEGSIAFTHALLSSLTGEPAIIINELVPEDWADSLVILSRTYQRFTGAISLFDQKEESGDPTTAGSPPGNSSKLSGALPGN